MPGKWVVVVGESDYWDDGVGRVIGPFESKEAADAYAKIVDKNLCAEVFALEWGC